MHKGLIVINSLLSASNSLPTTHEIAKRDTGISKEDKNFYGSWDWFIDQIAKENTAAEPTLSVVTTTVAPTRSTYRFQPRSFGSRASVSRFGGNFGSKVQENGEDLLADKFAWFSRDRPKPTPKPPQRPVQIMSRSGMGPGFFDQFGLSGRSNRISYDSLLDETFSRPFEEVQFLPHSDGNAIMYNTFQETGSGDEPEDIYNRQTITSFVNNDDVGRGKKNKNQYTNYYDEKPSTDMFTFHTHVPNTHYDPSEYYVPTRVEDNTLLPVQLTQEWPSNENALGGAIFEVMNFIFGNTGTCYIKLPVAVYWFHVFNAHIDPTESDPSSGTYALIAANQAFEGVSTLDFIVNFIGDDYRFNAADIELSCDSTNTWTTSLLSFPGNTLGDVGRTNVRAVDGFEGKKVVIQFIYDVENFHVDDKRLSVEPSNGVGNTFTISGLSGTYLEEVWFEWNYEQGGWFSAADVLVGYFDEN